MKIALKLTYNDITNVSYINLDIFEEDGVFIDYLILTFNQTKFIGTYNVYRKNQIEIINYLIKKNFIELIGEPVTNVEFPEFITYTVQLTQSKMLKLL